MAKKQYLCIDLKSFYASVECVERGLDPMTANLVVADSTRSDKTICLAVSPAMKKLGVPGRARVFQIPDWIEYTMAPPRMALYMEYSAKIYGIYLKYISKEDIHVYSVDEAFMDVTEYLNLYHMTAKELGLRIMSDIYESLGIRATCGIGTNLYLTKIALDVMAKRSPDFVGELDEESYKKELWDHKPLKDFWMIGEGTVRTLQKYGITTMRQIANVSEDFLYGLFGVNAELLIDHAWGKEPVTIRDIKNYKASTKSISSGQVLSRDYNFTDGRLIVKEMADLLCLDLVDQKLITESVTLVVGFNNQLHQPMIRGTAALPLETNADIVIIPEILKVYDEIVDENMMIRRVYITCNRVRPEEYKQYSFFADMEQLEKDRKMQEAVISLKKKFGKNAVLKGMNLQEAGTTIERNRQIGGHNAGELDE